MNWIILFLAGLFEVSLTFCLGKTREASDIDGGKEAPSVFLDKAVGGIGTEVDGEQVTTLVVVVDTCERGENQAEE